MTLFTTIVLVCGKVNFTNLSRYSSLSERTYRHQYSQAFEFAQLNQALVGRASQADGALLGVMDCSFVSKSGKATFGLDWFWNGTSSRVETGLEVSVVGVVEVATGQGYGLSAEQTYAQADLPEGTRLDQYLYHLDCMRPYLPPQVQHLAVDGAYAKESFVSGVVELELHVISKLRVKLEIVKPAINTLVLVSSSSVIYLAERSLDRKAVYQTQHRVLRSDPRRNNWATSRR